VDSTPAAALADRGPRTQEALKPRPGAVDFGDLARTEPIGRDFGGERGTPIDRYYIEGFLRRNARDVAGRVLEIGESAYTRRFGAERVTRADVLDVDERNPKTTIVADLASCPELPSEQFDCIILTQTLHMIFDVHAVVANVHRLLAPGGTALATAPGISQIDAGSGRETWFWSFTPRCLHRLFEDRFGTGAVAIESHGNVLAAVGFLHGLACEEMTRPELDRHDPLYPVITGVRAVRSR
jgi:SAM-dependent methyltransferase